MFILSRKKKILGAVTLLLTIGIVYAALTTNIVSYYKFDSSNSNDSVGSNNGSDTAITYSTANGKINVGAGFNGSTSKISLGNVLGSTFTGTFTINMWCNITDFSLNTALISKSNAGGVASPLDVYASQTSGTVNFYLGNGAGSIAITSNSAPSTGSFVMYTFTSDGSATTGGMNMYFNNSLQAVTPAGTNAVADQAVSTIIGSRTDGVTKMKGACDEIGIWSRVLSGAEITSLYNGGAGFQYPFSTAVPFGLWFFNYF